MTALEQLIQEIAKEAGQQSRYKLAAEEYRQRISEAERLATHHEQRGTRLQNLLILHARTGQDILLLKLSEDDGK